MKCWKKIPNVAFLEAFAKKTGLKKVSLQAIVAFFLK